MLPTRVINHWDFLKYRVCDEAAAFLDQIYDQPLLCVSALNPQLYDMVSQLRHVRLLRLQLIRMKDFVETCRQGSELRRGLDDRGLGYLMENTEMYSMRDLFEVGIMVFHMQVDLLLFPPFRNHSYYVVIVLNICSPLAPFLINMQINNSELIKVLMGVVEVIAVHISRECAQCSARGFICEMCNDPTPIRLRYSQCSRLPWMQYICPPPLHCSESLMSSVQAPAWRKIQDSAPKVASMQTAIGLLLGPAWREVAAGETQRLLCLSKHSAWPMLCRSDGGGEAVVNNRSVISQRLW